MSPILVTALPYVIQYGVLAVAFVVGHISGWFHRKLTEKNTVNQGDNSNVGRTGTDSGNTGASGPANGH